MGRRKNGKPCGASHARRAAPNMRRPGMLARASGGGGVATFVRQPCVARTTADSCLSTGFNDCRVMHSIVATGNGSTFLHVFVVYAHSGNKDRKVAAARESLLHSVLFEAQAQIGNAPAVVLGDLNTDATRSATLKLALENSWVDAAGLQATTDGASPPATYTSSRTTGTRIDYVLLNRAAAQSFVKCSTFAVGGIPNHRCVSVTLNSLAFSQTTFRYKIPRAIPAPSKPIAVKLPDLTPFYDKMKQEDVDGAWLDISNLCERFLLDTAGVGASEAKQYSGRGVPRKPVRVQMASKTSFISGTVASEKELGYGATIRRLEHYIASKSSKRGGQGSTSGELQRCWKNCRNVLRRLPDDFGVGRDIINSTPSVEQARTVLHRVQARLHELNKKACKARRKHWHSTVAQMFSSDRKALVSILQAKPDDSADMVEDKESGKLTANMPEMLEILEKAWTPILRMYPDGSPEPGFAPFLQEYADAIGRHPMAVKNIKGSDLLDLLSRRKKKSASCGVDGWRADEVKRLPLQLLNAFADFFNLVEKTGKWPGGLLTALVTLIPKDDNPSPTNLRPITVTSTIYRLWACRRLKDIMVWQEKWALDSQHGFRPGHRTDDVLMELTSMIEETLLDDSKELFMLALDFQKCFDRVPQTLTLDLAEHMGLDKRILRPLRAMYKNLTRRFKLPLGVGECFEVTNGILQGCPISVILINALLSVLFRAIERRVPGCISSSFADDATLASEKDESTVQEAVDIVDRFCNITGMKLNVKKTLAMGILKGTSEYRRKHPYLSTLHVGADTFSTTQSTKILGAKTCTSDKRVDRGNDKRLDVYQPLLSRMPSCPLATTQRAELVGSNIVSSAVYGGSYAPISKSALTRFRSRLTTGIIGMKHPSRSVGAVLNILHKGHRTDPSLARSYQIVRTLLDTCVRIPHLVPRLNRIAGLYDAHPSLSPAAGLGPVGIALADGLPAAGLSWGTDILDISLGDTRLLPEERAARNHIVREQMRMQAWKALASHRPSFSGIQDGVDYIRTNKLRLTCKDAPLTRALTVTLAGGVFFAARWGRNKAYASRGERAGSEDTFSTSSAMDTDDSDEAVEEEEAEESEDLDDDDLGSDIGSEDGDFVWDIVSHASLDEADDRLPVKCVHCSGDVDDTPDHLWWGCSAFEEIRSLPQYAALVEADRSGWPRCLSRYGVVPLDCTVDVETLHKMMGTIVLRRWELEAKRRDAAPLIHPWVEALDHTAAQHVFDFSRVPEKPSARLWQYSCEIMRGMHAWLAALQWTSRGEVSNVELALDFEVFTGLDVTPSATSKNTDDVHALLTRGHLMGTLLSHYIDLCDQLCLPRPIPAGHAERVNCLRSLGAPDSWGGLDMRPHFAGGEETVHVLEDSAKRAAFDSRRDGVNWGMGTFPNYDGIPRLERAEAWDAAPPPPVRSAIPVRVPADLANPDLPAPVCQAHSKARCAGCNGAKRNYKPHIEACCRAHHNEDDGLEVRCCTEHSMTRCGTCTTADKCCSAGHHELALDSDMEEDSDDDSDSTPPDPGASDWSACSDRAAETDDDVNDTDSGDAGDAPPGDDPGSREDDMAEECAVAAYEDATGSSPPLLKRRMGSYLDSPESPLPPPHTVCADGITEWPSRLPSDPLDHEPCIRELEKCLDATEDLDSSEPPPHSPPSVCDDGAVSELDAPTLKRRLGATEYLDLSASTPPPHSLCVMMVPPPTLKRRLGATVDLDFSESRPLPRLPCVTLQRPAVPMDLLPVHQIPVSMTHRLKGAWVGRWTLTLTKSLYLPPCLTCVLKWLQVLVNPLRARQLRSLPPR